VSGGGEERRGGPSGRGAMETGPEDGAQVDGWVRHEAEQRRAWLRLSYAERLAWLEEARAFVQRVGVRLGERVAAPAEAPEPPLRPDD